VFDVSERELRVIAHLTFAGPMSASELAATMHVTRGGMSAILQRLSANGWVDVLPDPEDRRRSRVLASERSLDLFDRWLDSLRATLAGLGHLPPGFVDGLVMGGRAFRQHRELLAGMGPVERRNLVDS
jgi:DNA-binding MarR family transcriptional regulator